ncbi:MAG: hypothetical protein AB1Z38_07025, partial [Desulfotignum sp.]
GDFVRGLFLLRKWWWGVKVKNFRIGCGPGMGGLGKFFTDGMVDEKSIARGGMSDRDDLFVWLRQ